MHAHFERPRNKVKNITSKSRKKIKILPMLCLNFDFTSHFEF